MLHSVDYIDRAAGAKGDADKGDAAKTAKFMENISRTMGGRLLKGKLSGAEYSGTIKVHIGPKEDGIFAAMLRTLWGNVLTACDRIRDSFEDKNSMFRDGVDETIWFEGSKEFPNRCLMAVSKATEESCMQYPPLHMMLNESIRQGMVASIRDKALPKSGTEKFGLIIRVDLDVKKGLVDPKDSEVIDAIVADVTKQTHQLINAISNNTKSDEKVWNSIEDVRQEYPD